MAEISTTEAGTFIKRTGARVRQLLRAGKLKGRPIDGRTWVVDKADAVRLARQLAKNTRRKAR